ncbi:hypothetical protein HDU96_008921 [Phlyctochytrium bullatum]|nr:hypothetical protein HDU96_008921 [Phlyctochytrium bullatum]
MAFVATARAIQQGSDDTVRRMASSESTRLITEAYRDQDRVAADEQARMWADVLQALRARLAPPTTTDHAPRMEPLASTFRANPSASSATSSRRGGARTSGRDDEDDID